MQIPRGAHVNKRFRRLESRIKIPKDSSDFMNQNYDFELTIFMQFYSRNMSTKGGNKLSFVTLEDSIDSELVWP